MLTSAAKGLIIMTCLAEYWLGVSQSVWADVATTRPVQVSVDLKSTEIYIGEAPEVIVTFRAGDSDVQVCSFSRAATNGAVLVKVFDPDDRLIPGAIAVGSSGRVRNDDLRTLPAGSHTSSMFKALARARRHGRHKVRVDVQPTTDGRDRVVRELDFQVIGFNDDSIVAQMDASVQVEPDASKSRSLDGTVKILKVRQGNEYRLYYHFRSLEKHSDFEVITSELWKIKQETLLVDMAVSQVQSSPLEREIWIVYEEHGQRFMGRVRHGSGRVLAVTKLEGDMAQRR